MGGASRVDVTTSSGCPWSATTTASWILLKGAKGQGSGSFTYSVSKIRGQQRTGKIIAGGQSISITQLPESGPARGAPAKTIE